jgi:hypothetical protein
MDIMLVIRWFQLMDIMALKFELIWTIKIRKQHVVNFYPDVMDFGRKSYNAT